jgi:hypothetical protein
MPFTERHMRMLTSYTLAVVCVISLYRPAVDSAGPYVQMVATDVRDYIGRMNMASAFSKTIREYNDLRMEMEKDAKESADNELLAIMEWHLQKRGCPLEGYARCATKYTGIEWPNHERFIDDTVARLKRYGTSLSRENWKAITYALRVPELSVFSMVWSKDIVEKDTCDTLLWEEVMRAAWSRATWDPEAQYGMVDVRARLYTISKKCISKLMR